MIVLFAAYLISLSLRGDRPPAAVRSGAFSQCCYRFNTYVGLAVAISLWAKKARPFRDLLISLIIPTLNVAGRGTLIWFSEGQYGVVTKTRLLLRAMILNPLIIACLVGIATAGPWARFPPFVRNLFRFCLRPPCPWPCCLWGTA
jgi:predicted permease